MSTVRVDVDEGVAVVTLDDPGRRNAMTMAMVGDLTATFDELEARADVGAVVITGAGSTFCAGADLSQLADASGGRGRDRDALRGIYEGFLRVGRSPLPTIAAVNGPAVGAGMNLALACDLRVAGRSARFDSRFLELGLHPGGGHTWMLHRIVGPQTAAAIVLFGQVLDGEAAAACGLAWRCVDDVALHDEARTLARWAASAPELARRIKATLGSAATIDSHATAVEAELGPQLWSMQQPTFADRLAALRARVSRDRG